MNYQLSGLTVSATHQGGYTATSAWFSQDINDMQSSRYMSIQYLEVGHKLKGDDYVRCDRGVAGGAMAGEQRSSSNGRGKENKYNSEDRDIQRLLKEGIWPHREGFFQIIVLN